MSTRSTHRPGSNKGFRRTQQIYVPKTENPNSTVPFTTSLRGPDEKSDSKLDSAASRSPTKVEEETVGNSVSRNEGRFVNYLPQDEAVAAGLGVEDGGLDANESQRVVDILNRELSLLLKMNPREFWKEVASDNSLHEFLDSYLQFRVRWYDLPHHGSKGIVAGVIVGELELSRRVFMVFYRISSNKDPGARGSDSLSAKEHGALLQEKKLLSLPKLLDICAIYGHDNEELTRLLVMNSLQSQPRLVASLTMVASHFLSLVHTMHQRLNSSLEVLVSPAGGETHKFSRLNEDFVEVMDFVNDAISTLSSFVDAYKPAALYFSCPIEMSYGNEELLTTLARLHDSLLPSLQQGFAITSATSFDDAQPSIVLSITMLSIRIVNLGWKLLDFCYLSDALCDSRFSLLNTTTMFPAKVEEPVIRGDILVQTFREMNIGISYNLEEGLHSRTFLQNIEKNHKILSRLDALRTKGYFLNPRFHYQEGFEFSDNIRSGVTKVIERLAPNVTFAIEATREIAQFRGKIGRFGDLTAQTAVGIMNPGWISMDDEQYQYLSLLTTPFSSKSGGKESEMPIHSSSDNTPPDDDAAIIESKISQIKDLFPDYGKGFLSACLEVYNQNPEEVIQRILERTLHQDLLLLETSLEKIPSHKSKSLSKEKGKGVLVEPVPQPKLDNNQHERGITGLSSSSISYGRFVRKSTNESPDSVILDSRTAEETKKSAILAANYDYEDEYDDSFDDLGLSLVESGFEETEGFGDGNNSIPGKSGRIDTESSGPAKNSGPRWNSQRKPQFYVKDGKNYSYKVSGSVAVSNAQDAAIVTQAQKETIHGLGRGGNLPLGAVKLIMESNGQENQSSGAAEAGGRGNPNPMGRGRGRRGGGNHHRKDQSMKKHFGGLSGF